MVERMIKKMILVGTAVALGGCLPINTPSPNPETTDTKERGMCQLDSGWGYVDYGYDSLKNPYTGARYPIIPSISGSGICTVTLPEGCSPIEYRLSENAVVFDDPTVLEEGQLLQAYRWDKDGNTYNPLGTSFLSKDAYAYQLTGLPPIEFMDAMCEVE